MLSNCGGQEEKEEDEDAHHFITVCPSLSVERTRLLASAPDAIGSKLPDPTLEPSQFTSTVLGINWIEHLPTQSFCIQFLDQLRNFRSSVLYGSFYLRWTLIIDGSLYLRWTLIIDGSWVHKMDPYNRWVRLHKMDPYNIWV